MRHLTFLTLIAAMGIAIAGEVLSFLAKNPKKRAQ